MKYLLFIWLAGCTQDLPAIEIDASSVPVGSSLTVAPCHPTDDAAGCALHAVSVLNMGEASATGGIFGIPDEVNELTIQFQQGSPSQCLAVHVTRHHNDQKIKVVAGATLTISCDDGDCTPPVSCASP